MPASPTSAGAPLRLLVEDDFQRFDPIRWRVEAEDPATRVEACGGHLLIDSPAGVTVWLAEPLDGAYRIEFERQVLVTGGRNDRLSDLNQFWAAREPGGAAPRPRSGRLQDYDSLCLYYVGMGGNGNSTTRFRCYDGSESRPLLGECDEPARLLSGGRRYAIAIDLDEAGTTFHVDGRPLFQARHAAPPGPGLFGFRTVWSRQLISGFRVWRT